MEMSFLTEGMFRFSRSASEYPDSRQNAFLRTSDKEIGMRYNTLVAVMVVVLAVVTFERAGRAQGNNEPPSPASISFGVRTANLMQSTLFAALLQEFAETTPVNAEQGKQSIGLIFDDDNHSMRLVGALQPLSDNDFPEDTFEASAQQQAMIGQGATSVERVEGKWYYRRSIPLSNFHPACAMCHTNFGPVDTSQWVGALMLRVPLAH
jgi:hypothetical protein